MIKAADQPGSPGRAFFAKPDTCHAGRTTGETGMKEMSGFALLYPTYRLERIVTTALGPPWSDRRDAA